jgi:hypothetical protein
MNLLRSLRKIARWGRAILRPIGPVPEHLRSLVGKTGHELGFDPSSTKQLEIDAYETIKESGI